jgi:CRISPR-associated protein Cmr2
VSRSLLLFTIGPVQPFIEQARKTRDLWLGSFLLSKLMEAEMAQFVVAGQETPSPKLIFPARPKTSGKIPDLPNKFVAILASEEEAANAAGEALRRLRERWETIAAQVWEHLLEQVPAIQAAQAIWERQVIFERFFEVYWAIALEQPGAQQEEPYGEWYSRAQRALDARKRLRDFQQDESESGEKSTISGTREALRGERGDLEGVREFWKTVASGSPEAQISHDGSERLDAIDTIKRFATQAQEIPELPFPSTSTVAAAPFIAELLRKLPQSHSLREAVEEWERFTSYRGLREGADPPSLPYLDNLASGPGNARRDLLRRDGDCYYPETFTPNRLEENYGLPNPSKPLKERADVPEEQLERVRKLVSLAPAILRALRRAAAEASIPPLTPYYAILMMDGDHMGTLLSKVQEQEDHKAISAALSHFSRDVAPPKVETDEYPAKLVYAGGDDVLALSPSRAVLPLSNALQEAYLGALGPATEALRKRTEEKEKPLEVTMSAGIAIAHYLDPLSHVLREARWAEKTAKNQYGRNAVVVTLLRRSGEATMVGCKWRYPDLKDKEGQPLKVFQAVERLLEQEAVSNKFVYILAEEAATLSSLAEEAQESEIRRLLARATDDKKLKALSEDVQQQWKALPTRLARLATEMNPRLANGTKTRKATEEGEPDEVELWRDGPRRGLVEVSGWLLLMAFLQRGGSD